MPSPDVADYIGLELMDIDAQQLVEQALASAAVKFPGWTAREGNTEVMLLELLAAMSEEEVYALNRAGDGIVERVLLLTGVTRDLGAPSTVSVQFTAGDTTGYTVPAGTTVRLDDGVEGILLTTDTPVVIAPGATTGTTMATATTVGVAGNGIPINTELEVLDSVAGIESAVTITAPSGSGRDAEDTAAYLARATARLATLTTTLVRPQDVEAYVASSYPAIKRVKVLDRYNPSGGTVGDNLGYVAVAVASTGGAALSVPAKDALDADLTSRMQGGLIINIIDATLTTVAVTVNVLRLPGYTTGQVQASVAAVLTDYLNPDTWAWSGVVRRNELIARIDTAAGVDSVLDITLPAADVILAGAAALAVAGVITVTVQAP